MNTLSTWLGVSDNPLGLLIWAAILLGPALVGILRRFLASLGAPQGEQQPQGRFDEAPAEDYGERDGGIESDRAGSRDELKQQRPSAADTRQGKEMWKQLLRGETPPLPATPSIPKPPALRPRQAPMPVTPPKHRADSAMFPTEAASEARVEIGKPEPSLARPKSGSDRSAIRAAILWSEVLAPPLALRAQDVPGSPGGPGGSAHP